MYGASRIFAVEEPSILIQDLIFNNNIGYSIFITNMQAHSLGGGIR